MPAASMRSNPCRRMIFARLIRRSERCGSQDVQSARPFRGQLFRAAGQREGQASAGLRVNKPAVRAIAYSGSGQSIWNPIPPSSWAYTNIAGYSYNLQKAKALLAQAGESHLSLTVIVPSGYPEGTQTADIWQQSLQQIGVKLNVDVEQLSVWLDQYVKEQYQLTWNVFDVKGDPDSFYSIIMVPHLKSDYHNPAMLSLEAKALATSNIAARKSIYSQMDNMVVNQLPVMPIQTEPLYSVVSKDVTGWRSTPWVGPR